MDGARRLEPYDQAYRDGWHDVHISPLGRRKRRRARDAEYALGYRHGRTDGATWGRYPEWRTSRRRLASSMPPSHSSGADATVQTTLLLGHLPRQEPRKGPEWYPAPTLRPATALRASVSPAPVCPERSGSNAYAAPATPLAPGVRAVSRGRAAEPRTMRVGAKRVLDGDRDGDGC